MIIEPDPELTRSTRSLRGIIQVIDFVTPSPGTTTVTTAERGHWSGEWSRNVCSFKWTKITDGADDPGIAIRRGVRPTEKNEEIKRTNKRTIHRGPNVVVGVIVSLSILFSGGDGPQQQQQRDVVLCVKALHPLLHPLELLCWAALERIVTWEWSLPVPLDYRFNKFMGSSSFTVSVSYHWLKTRQIEGDLYMERRGER